MEPTPPKRQVALTAAVVIVLIAVAAGVMAFSSQPDTQTASTTSSSPSPSPSPEVAGEETTPTPAASSGYKNGSYTAIGSYRSPGGTEQVTITLTLKDGVVTDTTAVSGSTNPTGTQYQGQFIAAYKDQVVGKSLDSLNLSKVSGSSLTPQGFNDAVSQIKTQAKA